MKVIHINEICYMKNNFKKNREDFKKHCAEALPCWSNAIQNDSDTIQ